MLGVAEAFGGGDGEAIEAAKESEARAHTEYLWLVEDRVES